MTKLEDIIEETNLPHLASTSVNWLINEVKRLQSVVKQQNQDLHDLRAYRDKASQIFENGGCPPGKGFDYGLCPTVKGKCEGCTKRYIREGK